MNLRPLKDGLIVRPIDPPKRFGLIFAPETVLAENPNYFGMTGEVIALGPGGYEECDENKNTGEVLWGGRRKRFDVKVGDVVLFNRYAGKQVTCDDDGILYLVMKEREVLGIVPPELAGTILPGYMPAEFSAVKDLPKETTR